MLKKKISLNNFVKVADFVAFGDIEFCMKKFRVFWKIRVVTLFLGGVYDFMRFCLSSTFQVGAERVMSRKNDNDINWMILCKKLKGSLNNFVKVADFVASGDLGFF